MKTECILNTNLPIDESCYVVQGIMSIALCSNCNDQSTDTITSSTYAMDLEAMYLDAIKTGMDQKEFVSNHVLNVTYIGENTLIANGSSYINSNNGYTDVNNSSVQNNDVTVTNTIQNDDNITNAIQVETIISVSENTPSPIQKTPQPKNIILIGILVVVGAITLMIFLATMRLLCKDFRKWYKRHKARKKEQQNSKEIEKNYKINHSISDGTIGIGKNPLLSSNRFGWNMSSIVPVDEELAFGVRSI